MISFRSSRRLHLALGRQGERWAAAYLQQKGHEILARNWRTEAGELDIVSWDGKALHFVEVKSLRRKAGFTPMGNLSPRQRRRNFYAGKVYWKSLNNGSLPAHYDLLAVEYSQKRKFLSCRVLADYLPMLEPLPAAPFPEAEEPTEERPKSFWQRLWACWSFFTCPLCLKSMVISPGDLCPDCLKNLRFLPPPDARSCPGCGGPLDGVLAFCSHCMSLEKIPLWQGIVSVFEHSGQGRQMILDFKFGGQSELARPLGKMGAQAVRKAGFEVDCVVSVPLHFWRKIKRSYDQAALFGEFTGKYLNIPYVNCLKRIKYGAPQSTLGRSKRLKNLKNAFVCTHPEKIAGKRILLVDDVFTTGSTLSAAAATLIKCKPQAVYVLTISRRPALFKKTVSGKNIRKIKLHDL